MATSGEVLTKDDLTDLALQVDEVRGELIEEVKQRFDALWTFLQHPPESEAVALLEEVIALLRPARVRRPWWQACRWPGVVLLSALVGGGASWWLWGTSAQLRTWGQLGQRLDGVVVEHYLGLSVPAREAMNGLYRQLNLATPGDRKGKRS
jgi:hypothetical protein